MTSVCSAVLDSKNYTTIIELSLITITAILLTSIGQDYFHNIYYLVTFVLVALISRNLPSNISLSITVVISFLMMLFTKIVHNAFIKEIIIASLIYIITNQSIIYIKYRIKSEKTKSFVNSSIFDNIETPLIIYDEHLHYQFTNRAYRNLVNLDKLIGKTDEEIFNKEQNERYGIDQRIKYVRDTLENYKIHTYMDHLTSSGVLYQKTIRTTPILSSNSANPLVLVQFLDNTIEIEQTRQIERMNNYIKELRHGPRSQVYNVDNFCVAEWFVDDDRLVWSSNSVDVIGELILDITNLDQFLELLNIETKFRFQKHLYKSIFRDQKQEKFRLNLNAIEKFFEIDFQINYHYETNEVAHVIIYFFDVSEYIRINENLEKQINKKDIIVRESIHRFKNNLHTVAAYIDLQSQKSSNKELSDLLNDSKSKILSLLSLQEYFMNSDNLSAINVQSYLTNLIHEIQNTLNIEHLTLTQNLMIEPVLMNKNDLEILSFILTELVTNSFKYAFNESADNFLTFHLYQQENYVYFTYKDQGSNNTSNRTFSTGSGLGIIEDLVNLLIKGKMDMSISNGVKFTLQFVPRD